MRVTKDADHLRATLARIDGRGYKAYKDIRGAYQVDELVLYIDYVQGDPFASPSKIRVRLDGARAGFPPELYGNPDRKRALEDYLLRVFDRALGRVAKGHRGSGKSGMLAVDTPGQEVLERTAVVVDPEFTEVRLAAGLPARGRRVLGGQAAAMLLEEVPAAARDSLYYQALNDDEVGDFVVGIEDAAELRRQLPAMKAVAFIADGSILPRESGVSELPLPPEKAVEFQSPPSLAREVTLSSGCRVRGMVIPEGVTLIVGGGYHGKSTLLRAVDRGIYDHIPGDGRERVVTVDSAVKIRAEDGRQVTGVDISSFIGELPNGEDTSRFTTPTASGSTSQASNIVEALEMGARALLVDEDTSATNFMVRDMRMQRLVASEQEPITPFIDRVQQLHRERGVSTIVVIGGSGDYFDVADAVIMMDQYRLRDVTAEARDIAREYPTGRNSESAGAFPSTGGRRPDPSSVDPTWRGRVRVKTRGLSAIQFGEHEIDLGLVEQLVDSSQTRAVADILQYARKYFPRMCLREALARVEEEMDREGMELVSPFRGHPGDYARPRMLEVAAALNRLRSLRLHR